MKTKFLNLLGRTRNVLFATLVSGLILEIVILLFFGKFVGRNPNLWDTYNYVLAVLVLLSILMLILLHTKEENQQNFLTFNLLTHDKKYFILPVVNSEPSKK